MPPARERLPIRAGRVVHRLRLLPRLPTDMLRHLPLLLRVRRGLRREKDFTALLRSLTPPEPLSASPPPLQLRVRLVRGIFWLTRLLPLNPNGDCLVRSLVLFAALRERGVPAVFVTGVRREPAGIVGHAWVELDGRVLPELREPHNRELYQESVRYPPEEGRGSFGGGVAYSRGAAVAAPPG